MASVKRNDRCPCGSGKKYKKCCGSGIRPVTTPREATSFAGVPGTYIEHSLPMALHGQNQYVIFEPLPGGIRVGGGECGTYKVVFTLSRPGFSLRPEGRFFLEQQLEGDSHLYVRSTPETKEIVLALKCPQGVFDFHGIPNRSGCLGKLWTEDAVAKDYFEAERIAWTALSPALSWLSTHLDIPLHVEQVDVIDRHTGGQMAKFLLTYRTVGMSVSPVHNGSPDFQYYASLYREALCTNSPQYHFLCLYKIVDGVCARRRRASRDPSVGGPEWRPDSEVVPGDETAFKTWMDAIFPPAVRLAWSQMHFESTCRPEAKGKEFSSVVDAFLLPVRNRIAHALVGVGELGSSIDNAADMQTVFHWLPLLKCIARRMLKNEFPSELMPGLRDDGSFDVTEEERRKAEWRQVFER